MVPVKKIVMKQIVVFIYCLYVAVSCTQNAIYVEVQECYQDVLDKNINTKSTSSLYYWYKNERVYMSQVENTYFAIFKQDANQDIENLVTEHGHEFEVKKYDLQHYVTTNEDVTFISAKISGDVADEYSGSILYMAPYLSGISGHIGVSDRFYVKLKSADDAVLLEEFADQNGAKIISENFIPLWYTLVCDESSTENALELANKAHESGMFEMTDIEFIDDAEWYGSNSYYNDEYYASEQWNLHGTHGLDIENVHCITQGSPLVKVAVIDASIQLNHPDLVITDSWDAWFKTSPGRLYYANGLPISHGTSTVGIIGATANNSIGIAGISPSASLLPITVGAEVNKERIATAINHAITSGADVISNSYGFSYKTGCVEDACLNAINNGCLFIQASGNDNTKTPKYPYAAIPEVIVVGNTTIDGLRCHYSSTYGHHLDIVAPGTDIKVLVASSTYNTLTGTSFSTPHVAATAALILSVNKELTRGQVTEIIEKTAKKLPNYSFTETRSNGSWNEEVGYGLINATDAVCLAKGYYNLISFDYTGSSIEFSITADKNIAIIWDWETEDITEVSMTSSTEKKFTHNFNSEKKRRIYISEKINLDSDTIPNNSTALTKFTLTTGEAASNMNVRALNNSLESICIIGGRNMCSQAIDISNLPSLKDLYLVHMPGVSINIDNCPSLLRFGSSNYIWGAPSDIIINPDLPMLPIEDEEIMDPDIVDEGATNRYWPNVPISIQSFSSLNITDCQNLTDISLENVGITEVDFSQLPNLRYLYVSSQEDKIVGGTDNSFLLTSRGRYLANTIATLPSRAGKSKGEIRARGVNSSSTEYIAPVISMPNQRLITETYCADKNWEIIWEPGVNISLW